LAELELDWVSLRATLVYGPGVKGNMAQLVRLARSPFPLPVGSMTARRSLLALQNLSLAIETVLKTPGSLRQALIVTDNEALTVGEMIAAMRLGLGRRPRMFRFSPALLEALFRSMGQEAIYQRISGSLVANPAALMKLGWTPQLTTADGLSALMQAE
jgi:UDP-glucose 4-epimerase